MMLLSSEDRAFGLRFPGTTASRWEIQLDVDLLRPLVAVERHDLADRAGHAAYLEQGPDGGVIRIPGGLVVDEDLDASLLGRGLDPSGVGVTDRERLLHHHVHVTRG